MTILETVRAAINMGGFLCEYANPYRWVPEIQEPVVALSLHQVNTESNQVTLRAEVVSPAVLGGQRCQEGALSLVGILQNIGGKCQVQGCRFDSKTELFSMAVLAAFHGDPRNANWVAGTGCDVVLGGKLVEHPLSFKAWRKSKEETVVAQETWHFQLEEILDGDSVEAVVYDGFSIRVTSGTVTESYTGCVMTSQERILEGGRLRQIRQGTAQAKTP